MNCRSDLSLEEAHSHLRARRRHVVIVHARNAAPRLVDFLHYHRGIGLPNARFTLIIGTNELAAGTVIVKNMESGEQREVPAAEVAESLTIA